MFNDSYRNVLVSFKTSQSSRTYIAYLSSTVGKTSNREKLATLDNTAFMPSKTARKTAIARAYFYVERTISGCNHISNRDNWKRTIFE